ncbi:MAG: hypothetical protein HFE95_02500 [Acutalibacter sp.]|nr:hypothetical protein [Acutalibacter sp.]
MKDISKQVYRNWRPALLTGKDGSTWAARGLVVRKNGTGTDGPGERHESGLLEEPRYIFTGWASQARPGDLLEQDGQQYRVLQAEFLCIGNVKAAARLVLEREVADSDSP